VRLYAARGYVGAPPIQSAVPGGLSIEFVPMSKSAP